MRRQRRSAGVLFCSLQATSQERQPMHLVMSKWKRYCSPGSRGRVGMRLVFTSASSGAGKNSKPFSVRRTMEFVGSVCASSWSGSGIGVLVSGWCAWLVDVAVVAVLILELLYVLDCGFARETCLLLDDGVEGGVDVPGHAGGVATDVDAGTFFKPSVEGSGLLEHSVLDVDLAILIAGEGEIEAAEMPIRVHSL